MSKRSAEELLMERFPKLGLLAPTFPLGQGAAEALTPIDLQKVDLLYIYGLGEGAAYPLLRDWLWEKPERKLVFLEDEPGAIASFLQSEFAVGMLEDERVFLELLSRDCSEARRLAEKWPVRYVEVAALASRKGRRFHALRIELLRKTALSHALHIDRLHGYQPFQNFVQNLRRLPHSFYANGLKGAFAGTPAIVCGAGPSLSKAISFLSQCEKKALLIAGGSTVAALSSQGVMPHFSMAIDPNREEHLRFQGNSALDVPLLYSTRLFSQVFQTCNGPFGYMRSGIGGAPELWIEEELGLLDPLLGEHLPEETISVTGICLAWAIHLGCSPIVLSGIDLAYTGNKRYAVGVKEEEELIFAELKTEKSVSDQIVKRKDRLGRPIHTAIRWLIEAKGFSQFAKKHREVQWWNTTEGGLPIQGIPYRPLSEVLSTFQVERNLRLEVAEKIKASPMPPHTQEIIAKKLEELTQSLDRIIGFLEILAGEKKGSTALAEFDLREEYAFAPLFYDIDSLFAKEEKWSQFLQLAKKYRLVLADADSRGS